MEFPFNINELLPEVITRIDGKLSPFRGLRNLNRLDLSSKQNQLKKVIDRMGEASARAQNLRTPITSAMKLECSEHNLYILKDSSANSGAGAVVGILKVGHKKLFVLDLYGVQNEVHPLCILDFYVHESCQRKGCGKMLFQHMLKIENVNPGQLAIDRPSRKFISFLKKHYELSSSVPQANNFVVFEQFFRDLQAVGYVPRKSTNQPGMNDRPPLHPYRQPSQHSADLSRRQWSSRASSHGSSTDLMSRTLGTPTENATRSPGMHGDEALKAISLPPLVPKPPSRLSSAGQRRASSLQEAGRPPSAARAASEPFNTTRGMSARATCYSRHALSREGSAEINRPRKAEPADARSAQAHSGGRVKSLHVTSADNPFTSGQNGRVAPDVKPQAAGSQVSDSAGSSRPSFLSPSGNYSISALYNSHCGPRRFLGTSWNVMGVPSAYPAQRNKNQTGTRTYPF